MPLISLADGLAHAREHRYALGAFNVLDSHFLRVVCRGKAGTFAIYYQHCRGAF